MKFDKIKEEVDKENKYREYWKQYWEYKEEWEESGGGDIHLKNDWLAVALPYEAALELGPPEDECF